MAKLPKRSEIDEKFKWQLTDIYPDEETWERDYKTAARLKDKLTGFSGTLKDGPVRLLECLRLSDSLDELMSSLYSYSRMRRDEDNGNGVYQGMSDRAADLMSEISSAAAFIEPEIIAIGDSKIKEYLDGNKELNQYGHYFHNLMRQKEHTLSEPEERILAMSAPVAEAASEIFGMFNNADIKFGEVEDENGEKTELTQGRYINFLESGNREVRKRAFEGIYAQYGAYKNTLAMTFYANIKKNVFFAKTQKYPSSINMYLSDDNIEEKVYDNLIDTVSNQIPSLTRYLKLRKRALRLDELHMYDLYTPIVRNETGKIPYEKACEIVIDAMAPLGEQYVADLKKAINERWIDVYENEGKTSGAYSWGSQNVHPYVLLNYQGNLEDVFTLAHELGHAMHSYYTNTAQPTVYKNYKIFVAEVASTVNENLLMAHLLKSTEDREKRAFLLNHKLEGIRTVVYRQTMFAEFERNIHRMYESGTPITAQELCEEYLRLNRKYYAPEAIIDDQIAFEWARIPHFYSSFYVYKYATGYSAAAELANGILNIGNEAVNRYLNFLHSGDSKYPLELLADAGADLSVPKPIEDTLSMFSDATYELETLI